MTKGRFLACAGAAFTAIILSTVAAPAQFVPTTQPRVGHIGMPLYLRIPVGSRAEAAALKADQDALLASQQTVVKKKKGKKR